WAAAAAKSRSTSGESGAGYRSVRSHSGMGPRSTAVLADATPACAIRVGCSMTLDCSTIIQGLPFYLVLFAWGMKPNVRASGAGFKQCAGRSTAPHWFQRQPLVYGCRALVPEMD